MNAHALHRSQRFGSLGCGRLTASLRRPWGVQCSGTAVAAPTQQAQELPPAPAATTTLTQREIEALGRPLSARLGLLDLMEQRFDVEGRVFTMVAPLDVDAILDQYTHRDQLDRDFYWARVWPSAVALARLILQRPSLVAGKRVVDLGAGLGLAGMAAALAGAREVVLLDREPLALRCALASAVASGVANVRPLVEPPAPAGRSWPADELSGADSDRLRSHAAAGSSNATSTPSSGSTSTSHADAAAGAQLHQVGSATPAPASSYSASVFDWSDPASFAAIGDFDVVLACDVLYEQTDVSAVAEAIGRLLKAQRGAAGASASTAPGATYLEGAGARLLLADPPRRTAANRERFLELLSEQRPQRLTIETVLMQSCVVTQLGHEGDDVLSSEATDVQLMSLRAVLGNDTVGVGRRGL